MGDRQQKGHHLAPDAAVTDTRRLVLEIHGSKSTSPRINGRPADTRREEAELPCPDHALSLV